MLLFVKYLQESQVNFMNLNYTRVLHFFTTAKYMNMNKAANELYISQPALSLSISRLEEELGPVTVVLTGGHGRDILPLLRRAVEYEPHLQLMGLRELWLRSL